MVRLRSPSAAAAARIPHATHAPCDHPKIVLAWRARRVRNASRCDSRQRPQPHHCVAFEKRYTM
eukprot:205893-Lingulodinium_polyedra.AAC.1